MMTRKEVPEELTWDLTHIYPDEAAFEADLSRAAALSEQMAQRYRGALTSPEAVDACLDDLREVLRLLTLTGSYASLAVSVDYNDAQSQAREARAGRITSEISSRLSFIDVEVAALPQAVLQAAAERDAANRRYLRDVLRAKPHQLSPEAERAVAALGQSFQAPYQIYNMAKHADLKFSPFTVNGRTYPLDYSLFEDNYQYERDTAVRRAAFDAFSARLRDYQNVTAAAYNTAVQNEKTLAALRGFDSVFDYLLFDHKVPRALYDRQIDRIVEQCAPHFRRYARLLQRVHGLDKLTYADLKLPLDPDFAPECTIEGSRRIIREGLSILGPDYQQMVDRAYRDRWIDFASNQGKSTGGFCETPYGCHSYILLSWKDQMTSVITLAHELGHAGHFGRCNAAQSIFDTNVSTYFAEAPSTMNELIMAHHLLKTSDDKRFRRWVLSCMVGTTYYHDFVTHLLEAAYQREVYRIVDAGGSVQADTLSGIMRDVLQKFWGDAVELTAGAELTWMRQPHYYMGLYSYTYSAGLTIATQMCKRIEAEGAPAVEDWKKVLTAGGTLDPIDLAAMAGVDITTDVPLLDTIATVGALVDEMYALTDELEQA